LLRVCRRKNILARFCHQPPKASRGQVCTTSRFAAPPLEETATYSPKKAQNRQKCTRRDELGLSAQYCSLNNPDSFGGIDPAGSVPLAWAQVVVAHLPLHPAAVQPASARLDPLFENLIEDRFMQGFLLPRGE
jgi:hypothetical protein